MPVTKKLIKYNHGGVNNPKYIVIHETGNTDIGADAERHYRYFNGGDRGASSHYFVDDKQIIQVVEHKIQSWHNGKKYVSNPAVPQCNNSNSIGIEICVNQDGDYSKAVAHAVELTKKLMKEFNIPVDRVIRHYDSCGKQCPAKMLREPKIWSDFKNAIQGVQMDEEYEKAIQVLVEANIIGSPAAWQLDKINMNNIPSLVKKMAKYVEGKS
ncbi:N-acetylmuramoyl-L-alanine amidase [Lachnospiraceae bacterium NSJ-12]|uniref:N-acetylmuramoyl-L-alanine amidase n=1 Tax=Zhenhengia yiwuensis TaxID=2763666 RepID=A0A926ELG6_9FIRM|nr:N-acetylmuramoyl-L-alanine amidase [Zhenhengia yiwuensis]